MVDAVSRLRDEGLDFDFQLVEGRTQAELREIYERADIVVDQLLVGWYGGLAVEAMALSRPTVAYLRESDLPALPAEMRSEIPVVRADPDTIYGVLRDLLTTRRHRARRDRTTRTGVLGGTAGTTRAADRLGDRRRLRGGAAPPASSTMAVGPWVFFI